MTQSQRLAIEVLRSWRGKRSAADLSRRLGAASNQVSRWESGHAVFRWKDLMHVARGLKIPVSRRFHDNLSFEGSPEDFRRIVGFFYGQRSLADLAKKLKISRPTLSKWMSGAASPPAYVVFEIVSRSAFSRQSLCLTLVPEDAQTEGLRSALSRDRKQTSVSLQQPWMIALLCLLTTEEFAKQGDELPIFLQKNLGFRRNQIEAVLRELLARGVLDRTGPNGAYVVNEEGHVDISPQKEKLREFLSFWNHYAMTVANGPDFAPTKNKAGYTVFTVHKDDLPKAHEIFVNAFRQLNELADSRRGTEVFVYTSILADVKTPTLGQTQSGLDGSWTSIPENLPRT
jgi:transcriptional regulator with XRE-family HTH domain